MFYEKRDEFLGILRIFNGEKLNNIETVVTVYCREIDAAGLIIRTERPLHK